MQATDILLTQRRYFLISGMLLVIMAIVPAVQATSLAPEIDLGSDQGSQAEAPANTSVSRQTMKFLEDNWYYDYAERDSQVEAEAGNPAPESDLDEFDFDAMERYPGLYTAPDLDEFDFDAMERYPGLYTEPVEADDSESEQIDPALIRDRIKFLEDNWHLDSGEVFPEDDENDRASAPSEDTSESDEIGLKIIRDQIKFLEDNWYYDTDEVFPEDDENDSASGPSAGNNADRADSLDELQNDTHDADLCEGETHDTLTYPCRGFQLHDY
jgi:hypothetical protein